MARVPVGAPFAWLRRGAGDLVDTRFVGTFYGAAFVAMGLAVVWVYATRWQLTLGLLGGFFLMGPFVCAGLYELSRQRARGEPRSLPASLVCWRRNPGSIALFAVLLTFVMIVWLRVSVIVFALASTGEFPTLGDVLSGLLSVDNLTFLLLWAGVGFVFASLAFAVGVVSVPMLLDRDSDTPSAVVTSVRTLLANRARDLTRLRRSGRRGRDAAPPDVRHRGSLIDVKVLEGEHGDDGIVAS